ncbi:MAG: ABC transporter ATP-binding protein [Haloarculaceae archaeon]
MDGTDDPRTDGEDRHPLGLLLGRYAGPHSRGFVLGLGALLLARIPQRIPALLIGVSLDALFLSSTPYTIPLVPQSWIPQSQSAQLWFTVAVLGGAVLAESALDLFARYQYQRATLLTLHDVRTATYDRVLGLEMAYFDDSQSGETMSVLNNDVNNLEQMATGVFTGTDVFGQLLMAFAFMFLLNWQLALLVGLIPILVGGMSYVYAKAIEARYDAVRESVGRVNARLEDTIEGIATVKANTRENHELERVRERSAAYRTTRWAAIKLRVVFSAINWFVGRATEHALLLVGGLWILVAPPFFLGGSLTPGTLLTFFMYTHSFLMPIQRLAVDVIDRIQNAHASAKRVVGVLASDRVEADSNADDLVVREGTVCYDDVSFTYPGADEQALRDVDFAVADGELVGVVGSTGAGKSTLLKLLFRFYDPDSGAIRVDGTDLATVSHRSVREHVGYVSQDPFLFDGTIRENVAYATPDAGQEAIERAARIAGAHEFVTTLPDGYDTEVGERGTKLSGGQRQRLAIARAVISDPPLVVFDEATSHVDNETEVLVQERLDDLTADRTTFVIAHRLSTVRDADRILVLDDGRIVEEGSHGDLLEAGGAYANLWHVQVGELDALPASFLEAARAHPDD